METIDLTARQRTSKDWIEVAALAERQRQLMLAAKAIEMSGRPVTVRELGRLVWGEESPRNSQRAGSQITIMKRRGLWPWQINGTNGVPTVKRLIWPDPIPEPAPAPPPVQVRSLAERQFTITVVQAFAELPDDARLRLWPHVKAIMLETD